MRTREIQLGPLKIGRSSFTIFGGPCSVESYESFSQVARGLKEVGVTFLRGGLFKLRTNPDSFQGLGYEAFDFVQRTKKETSLQFVTEISDPRQVGDLDPIADIFQVGSRNMHNYALLKELSQVEKPVLLKRGFCATVEEWLLAADYLRQGRCQDVILCERGIRTFDSTMRNTLDLSAVAFVKQKSDLPVIVDPSHGTGRRELVLPMSLAAVAAGADGLLIEVHPDPEKALSDGYQTINLDEYRTLVHQITPLLEIFGRTFEKAE